MAPAGLSLDRDLLPRLARALTACLDLGDVLAAGTRAAVSLAPNCFAAVWLVQNDRLVLRSAAGTLETTQSAVRTGFAIGEGLPGLVARTRRVLLVEDPGHDRRASRPGFLLDERVQWFAGVPLAGRYALQGVLGVFGRAEPLTAEALDALGSLADQVAQAVESARLEAEREHGRRQAEALAAVSQALAHSLDPGEVSQLIADSVIGLLGARDAVVFRLEPETGALVSLAFAGPHAVSGTLVLPRGHGLAGRAALERRLLTSRDARADPAITYSPELRERLRRIDVHAAMAAPLLVNGVAIGALGIGAGPGVVFGDEARRLLEAFADQASVALNTARLFDAERGARASAETAERRFRGLVESLDAVVVELEVATRQILFVSRRAESLLGYPRERWLSEPDFWAARLHPDDREGALAYTRAEAAAGRDHVQEYRLRAADGRVIWVRDSATLMREPGLPARLRCLHVDITERKRTEALLAGEKLLLEMIAAGESLPDVLQALCRVVEAQGDEGMHCTVELAGDEPAAPGRPRETAETGAGWMVPVLDVAGGRLATFVTTLPMPRQPSEADRRLLERAARLAGIAVERVRAEEALRASEQRYRTLVTNIPDVAWLVDRDGNTLFVSPNVEKVIGHTPDEVYRAGAMGWFGRIHPDDLPLVRRQFDALVGGAGTFDLEYRLRHRGGRWIWVHDRAVATYEEHGTTYVYGLYSDITDRKHAEQIRKLLLNQVITVQEEERRRIARELHDETAQSLASLLLGLSALGEVRTVKAARLQARDLHQVATRALAEVRRLAWGLRPSVLDDLGLVTALERYAEEFGRTRGVAIEVETDGLGDGRLPLPVETALYRIMQEALSNVARHAATRRVRLRLQRRAAAVAMVVEDDGRGFDPRQPPAPPTAARGLGIHTMRERAAVLRGTLSIDSAPGQGTRVAVEIPLGLEDP
jgi:PAS domain S-box-containing protein